MKNRRVPLTIKCTVAILMVLTLAPWIGIAGRATALDEQLMEPAKTGDLPRLKTVLKKGAALHAEDVGSTRPLDCSQRLTAASGAEKSVPTTAPSDQDATTDERPKAYIPPYAEEKRIAIPDTFGAGRQCHAEAYMETNGGFSGGPALLCFWCAEGRKGRTCFEAQSERLGHQFVDRLEIVPVFRDREPREAILFSAAYCSGSAWSTARLITLWIYRKECGQFVNILPEILIPWGDEFKFLSDPKGKHDGVLVVAEYAPAEEETREDRSAYLIKMYRYGPKAKKFQPIVGGEFLTEKKYAFKQEGLDTEIIDEQMERIKQLLDRKCNSSP
jgi:hypothetical protein